MAVVIQLSYQEEFQRNRGNTPMGLPQKPSGKEGWIDLGKKLWLCERKKDGTGKTTFKPLTEVEAEPENIPDIVVIEKGDPHELNEALGNLANKGYELLDLDHKHHNDFFSSFCATLINKHGRNLGGYFKKNKTVSAINRAIH